MTFVADASAVLAAMKGETGGARLIAAGATPEISTVNAGEVFSRLVFAGVPQADVIGQFSRLELKVRSFDLAHAVLVGELRPLTSAFGLSFADRACLAQAKLSALPILTGDHRQAEAARQLGFDVELIR